VESKLWFDSYSHLWFHIMIVTKQIHSPFFSCKDEQKGRLTLLWSEETLRMFEALIPNACPYKGCQRWLQEALFYGYVCVLFRLSYCSRPIHFWVCKLRRGDNCSDLALPLLVFKYAFCLFCIKFSSLLMIMFCYYF